ncbi:Uncharacterized protein dnm_044060 [Desulfonema magnum]|uniref:Uncharacterized protein n=1 Tax=Desulfonema magnum TaxID=45655 RepID=A0A975GP17_9BACT|nr:Uncharacterized protein dnm_044060 [Desulfonema magnum]
MSEQINSDIACLKILFFAIISRSKSFRDECGKSEKPGFFPPEEVYPGRKSRVSSPFAVSVQCAGEQRNPAFSPGGSVSRS